MPLNVKLPSSCCCHFRMSRVVEAALLLARKLTQQLRAHALASARLGRADSGTLFRGWQHTTATSQRAASFLGLDVRGLVLAVGRQLSQLTA